MFEIVLSALLNTRMFVELFEQRIPISCLQQLPIDSSIYLVRVSEGIADVTLLLLEIKVTHLRC